MPQTGSVRTNEIQNHAEHTAASAAVKNPKAELQPDSAAPENHSPAEQADKLHHGKAASHKK